MPKVLSRILFPSLALLFAASLGAIASAQTVRDPNFVVERIRVGNGTISVEFGPGGRLYVAEKRGLLLLFEPDRHGLFLAPTTILDLTAVISFDQESGLLGMVRDPDFVNTRFLYLLYTTPTEQKIVRIELTATFDGVVPDSETTILDGLPRLAPFHKAGDLQFHPLEPDVLYATLGDDGQPDWAQDPARYNGKMIRISKFDGFGLSDNPFYNGDPTSIESRVFIIGMRNPFRFVFHPDVPVADAVYISEDGVMTDRYSWARRGANGYWTSAGDQFISPPDPNFRVLGTMSPFLTGIAIARGGPFGDPDAPSESVLYICNPQEMGALGTIRRYRLTGADLDTAIPLPADNGEPFIIGAPGYDMAFGPDNALYLTQTRPGESVEGTQNFRRVRHIDGSPPISAFTTNPHPARGEAPLLVSFNDASSDFDGTIAEYFWDFGDSATSTSRNPTHTYNNPGVYSASLKVTDNSGLINLAEQTIRVVRTTTLSISGQIFDARNAPPSPLRVPAELYLQTATSTWAPPLAGPIAIAAGGVIDVHLLLELPSTDLVVTASASGFIPVERGARVEIGPGTHALNLNFDLSDSALFGRIRDTRGAPAAIDLLIKQSSSAATYAMTTADVLGFYSVPIRSADGVPGAAFTAELSGAGYVATQVELVLDNARVAHRDLVVGLEAGGRSCDALSASSSTTAIDYRTHIQPIWDGACTGCHDASSDNSAGLNLKMDSYRHLMEAVSAEVPGRKLIEPGDPSRSFLFEKINCADPQFGNRMRPMEALPIAQQTRIRDWIAQGALEMAVAPVDAGVAANADGGSQEADAGAGPLDDSSGCGCRATGTERERDGASGAWIVWLTLIAAFARRARR